MERAAPQSALLEALRSPFEFQGRQVVMRVSIGAAITSNGNTEPFPRTR